MIRPSSRCVHSHQKIVLNAAEAHAGIDGLVLRDGTVFLERRLPVVVA